MGLQARCLVSCTLVGLLTAASPTGAAPTPAAPLARAQDPASPERPRSLLFYVVDTCRADRMGFHGYPRFTTPFLSQVAERSVVFEACYSQAPWTKPSMASMLTSEYPSSTGVYMMTHRLPDEKLTWPEVMQQSGYYTAGFSANIVMGNILSNMAQGFDHFVESTNINLGDPIQFASGSAKKLNQRTFRWLDRTDHWPMLLYLHSVDPHEEYEPAPDYLKRFADPARHARFRDEWQRLLDTKPDIPGLYVTQDNFDRAGVDVDSFIEHGSNLYDADILANDDQMKLLWEKLEHDGWGEDFVFVFTSDHGEEFFEHGGTSHGYSLYDEMIRVPFLIYAPGLLPEGKRIGEPVRLLDVYPTLLDLLGIEIPEHVQGESLLPLIHDPDAWQDRPIVSEHREDPGARFIQQGSGVLVSIQDGPWKFILNQKSNQLIERPRHELYDLELDPGETENVAMDHPELVQEFEVQVATFLAEHRAGTSVEEWVSEDPEVLAQLRALGYIADDPTPRPPGSLWLAARAGSTEGLRVHLKHGTDVNARDPDFGSTALSYAATLGHGKAVQYLLDHDADVNAANLDGGRPLHGAAFFGQTGIVQLLLDAGADATLANNTGQTPLQATSADWDITQLIAQLLKMEIDRQTVNQGREEVARILREHLSEKDETSPEGDGHSPR